MKSEEDKLVEFFNSSAGYWLGKQGDAYGWTPAETAIRAIEYLLSHEQYPTLSQG